MIPVKLKLRNFMCYRDNVPPLDFTGIHLACLSGDNGNGKSAIIDAITWVVWGKARARSADDLIFSTQSEMEVEYDFRVGEQLYRIIRKRSRPKKRTSAGQSSLEFQIISPDGTPRPITGNTIDHTQQKIVDVLHMDYDTFINSAYLRQGHADEFTRQDPARRKEVLGNILGLAQYDQLSERAKELTKKQEGDSQQLENTINEMNTELAAKSSCEAELSQARSTLESIEKTVQEKEAALTELRRRKEALESKKVLLEQIQASVRTGTADLQRREQEASQRIARIKEYETILERKTEIETGYGRYTEAKKAAEELDQRFRQSVAFERQKNQLESRIEKARSDLTTEHTVVRRDIAVLEEKAGKLPALKEQLNQAQIQKERLSDNETTLRDMELAIQEVQHQTSQLEAENTRLQKEIAEANEKLDLINSHIALHTEARCPLCNQELTHEALELIRNKYTEEKRNKSDAMRQNLTVLTQKKAETELKQKEKQRTEADLADKKARAQSQAGIITREISGIEEESEKLEELRETLAAIEQNLAKREFAAMEQSALATLETELTNLGYDSGKHELARRQVSELEKYRQERERLDEAIRHIDREKADLARVQEEAVAKRHNLETDLEKQASLSVELTGLSPLQQELAGAEGEYQNLTAQRSQAQLAVGSVNARLQRLAELEIKKKEKEDRLAQLSRESGIYKELARAFGKTGIQALIIEAALPEIENEANHLLARMTDNRMHVSFETQKETKKGTIQETLDIAIADELGTRNYEMFSGGEAFRINFAIRIALSRLLAGRAGAPLPTLIIDEGFGTQDSTGLEKVKEAINSIQEDFEKILVITHMDELKDAFPNRIEVTKGAAGSMINVN